MVRASLILPPGRIRTECVSLVHLLVHRLKVLVRLAKKAYMRVEVVRPNLVCKKILAFMSLLTLFLISLQSSNSRFG